jgi:hypothetical protein
MFKKVGISVLVLLLAGIGFVWFKFAMPMQARLDKVTPDTAARDYALQDESKVTLPSPQPASNQKASSPMGKLYWGELHLHTAESFDSILFGNTLGVEDAYRFARGEPLIGAGGEVMQLTRPLDFVAITDHAEGFGTKVHCNEPGETTGCAFQTGFVRQGLNVGLQLDQELGFNPLQVGFVAATDSHNSNPGDVEEWDFRGTSGAVTSPALRRLAPDVERPNDKIKAYRSRTRFHTPGGLAAVWAPENNRAAIFDALARRETYATSGPRIGVRFHAGWGINETNVNNPLQSLMENSVPMGGVLHTGVEQQSAPAFFVWATRDPLDAPLQRVQMVKGWIDDEAKT